MERKNFKITVSLKEGYEAGARRHRINAVEKAIAAWMERRLEAKQPVLSGFLHEGKLLFPAKEKQSASVAIEPTAIFEGELSSPEDVKRSDKEVKETLDGLAQILKSKLKQQSVFISYRNDHWCV
jgi:hypothetical protein